MNTTNICVKVCGITNIEDAQLAIAAGADYLGFIFVPESPRHVTADQARAIIRQLPEDVTKVGVFVDYSGIAVADMMKFCDLDIAQLHGDEPVEAAFEIGTTRVWKMFHLADQEDVEAAIAYPAAALLVDTVVRGKRGGTGTVGNWELAAKVADARPVVLAGGLRVDNVRAAIRVVEPFAVDVCTGIELSPGRKDPELLKAFLAVVKGSTAACACENVPD